MSNATEVEPDRQGRILIPAKNRAHAHIEKNVIMMGVGARIEIWDPETYEKDAISDDMNEIAEELLGNGFEI
jgi:MraZ protein